MAELTVVHATPVLVAEAKSGLQKFWFARVLEDDAGRVYTQNVWWQVKTDGHKSAVQESTPALIEGKNLGKRNQTSPLEQAYAELNATVKQLRDKKRYRYEGEDVTDDALPRPMLAEKYLECADGLHWPVYVQAKLDGHRALYDGTRFSTRGGQLHKPHIQKALAFDTHGLVLDGEIMLDPACPALKGMNKVQRFQLSASAVKKDYPELTPWLRYYVYDCVLPEEPFSERHARLYEVMFPIVFDQQDQQQYGPVHLVATVAAASEDEVMHLFELLVKNGYEGAMIRDDSEGYRAGHRSTSLLKLKPFDDEEFEIIDVVPSGKGKAAAVGKFKCVTKDGVEFFANPRGTAALRKEYLMRRDELIGQYVTVHFEGYTDEGKPRFPRAIALREAWDR